MKKKYIYYCALVFIFLSIGFIYRSKYSYTSTIANDNFIIDVSLEKKTLAEQRKYLLNNFQRDILIGDEKAPITVIEYSSYTCTHCKQFHKNVYPELKKYFIDKGLVKYIHRPIINKKTILLASALRCIHDDEIKTYLNDTFFSIEDDDLLDIKNYIIKLLKKAENSVDMDRFNLCYLSKNIIDSIIYYQKKETAIFNIKSTPTFIIDGDKYIGNRSFKELETIITTKLSKKQYHVK